MLISIMHNNIIIIISIYILNQKTVKKLKTVEKIFIEIDMNDI